MKKRDRAKEEKKGYEFKFLRFLNNLFPYSPKFESGNRKGAPKEDRFIR